MAISEEAKKITDWIYNAYGTGTGCLFGIDADKRGSVEAIVDVTFKHLQEDGKQEIERN